MAGSVGCFIRLNLRLLSKNLTRHIVAKQTCTLFTDASLGVNGYNMARSKYQSQFFNLEDSFRSRMKSYVEDNPSAMIFTEDLKVMLHLAENTPKDKDLVIKMLNKFNGQSSKVKFTTFLFGPIVMRTFLRWNDPDLAIQFFNDPNYETFFNQLASYQIFLDLLYRNEKYLEILEVYDSIKTRITNGMVHPRNALILVTAACYKMNTPASLEYAKQLWQDLRRRGYPVVRRVLTHIGALAINQGECNMTLEILTTARKPRYIALRCLKIMAFCDIDRLDDVIPFFRASLEQDDPALLNEKYFKDTIDKVDAAIERANLKPDAEILKLLKFIKSGDFVQPMTLDDHINLDIDVVPRTFTGRNDQQSGNEFEEYSANSRPRFIRRPFAGLRERI